MNKSIFKSIIGGAILGALIFFTGPLLLIVFLLKFIFTPFGMGRMMFSNRGMGFGMMGKPPFAFADKIRNMSEEDYTDFKIKMHQRFKGHCGSKNEII
jgi:hypothetical protein